MEIMASLSADFRLSDVWIPYRGSGTQSKTKVLCETDHPSDLEKFPLLLYAVSEAYRIDLKRPFQRNWSFANRADTCDVAWLSVPH